MIKLKSLFCTNFIKFVNRYRYLISFPCTTLDARDEVVTAAVPLYLLAAGNNK